MEHLPQMKLGLICELHYSSITSSYYCLELAVIMPLKTMKNPLPVSEKHC